MILKQAILAAALTGLVGGCSLFRAKPAENLSFRAPPAEAVDSQPMNAPGTIIEDGAGCYHQADAGGKIQPLTGPGGQVCD
ncbi:hypothetical protein [Pseudooceanicola aestuarii]|uniref:hypothetical protein n=1 Tax=Pseudooceanicola aestuarii TaxID=2697319 RepID=UPI0013D1654E|nr:hypothetical protein [Pseudooceanicola aestuarii]